MDSINTALKPIQYIIIGIFVVSGLLSILLFQQKANRIDTQLAKKKEVGWNPVAIKKFKITSPTGDTTVLIKDDGVWKTNKQFDGMGLASQLLIYLSTMEIEPLTKGHYPKIDSIQCAHLQTFDKNGSKINEILIAQEIGARQTLAVLNNSAQPVVVYNKQNKKSLRSLLVSH